MSFTVPEKTFYYFIWYVKLIKGIGIPSISLLKNPPTSTAILLPINLAEIATGSSVGSPSPGGSQYSATRAKEFEIRVLPEKTKIGSSAKLHSASSRI